MTGTPLVSVITVSRNDIDGLRRTVASVRSQSFESREHVVVDGASTDGTPEWLAREGEELRWVSEPDHGIADAMNKAVAMCTGSWVLVLQAQDELVDDESLERASRWLASEADIVSFDVMFLNDSGGHRLRSRGFSARINFKSLPHQGAFVRRSLFERVGVFDPGLEIEMDYDFFLRARRSGARAETTAVLLSTMPASGRSSGLDWASLRERFREERLIQRRYGPSAILKAVYALYWPPYLAYRRIRAIGHRQPSA